LSYPTRLWTDSIHPSSLLWKLLSSNENGYSEGFLVIVEYIRYSLPPEDTAAFEQTYRKVGPLLDTTPHCLGWEVRRSVERPTDYVIRIEWDTLAGHEEGWRQAPAFQGFFDALKVFASSRQDMSHFERVLGSG
jgi:heme-degrading monooxygenase HmoA